MWIYILFYSTTCIFVNHALTLHYGDKVSHTLALRHVNEGEECVDWDENPGICKDDREIDFDAAGFEAGCYHPDKPCWLFNFCEGHIHCYITFLKADGTRLDDTCLALGGHCVKPGTRLDGRIIKDICPCHYDCYIQVTDAACTLPDRCQPKNAPCGGQKVNGCNGDGFVCCVSHQIDNKCTAAPPTGVNGVCQDNTLPCAGWYEADRCSGFAGRQCCVPPGDDTDCTKAPYYGVCQDTTKERCTPDGDYTAALLCSGPANSHRKCCVDGCRDFYGDKPNYVLTECHWNNGCCRPIECKQGEREVDFECIPVKDKDDNIIEPTCVCCIDDIVVKEHHERLAGMVDKDPHYNTLDNKDYQFDGHCSYVLLRECNNPLGNPRFTVIAHHSLMESLRRKLKAYVDSTSVIVGTFRADLLHGNVISINNQPAMHIRDLRRWNDTDKGITVTSDRSMIKVDMAGEFTVWFNGNGRAEVAIDKQYHGKVCGLLGNANDDPDDDFQKLTTHGLELVTNVNEFANSWVVPDSCP